MNRLIINILTSCLLLLPAAIMAQNKPWAGFGIEVNPIWGQVLRHSKKFKAPLPEYVSGVDIHAISKTWGKKDWQIRRHYPTVGFGFQYLNYGIDSIYGRAFGLYPDLQIPIVMTKHFEWTLRVGYGGCFVTNHFQRGPNWDTLNTAMSSNLNNMSVFVTDLRYHVNEHIDVQAGANFTHVSNAAFKQPNLGLNAYGFHVGLRYFPVTSAPVRVKRELPKLRNRWLFNARLGLSFNESGFTDGPIYPVYLTSLYMSRRWHSHNKMFAGIDYSYHKGIEAFLRNNEVLPGKEKQNSWKSAVFVGNEFLVGRVGIVLQVGVYIKEAALRNDPYYEKLGGVLYLIQREKGVVKEMSTGILLKTHKAQAELAEFCVNFGF